MSKVKIMGTPKVFSNPDNNDRLEIRYGTYIYRDIKDPSFLLKISQLGFFIEHTYGKQLRVYLPKGWAHLRLSKEKEVVIDEHGRERIVIDRIKKVSRLLRRFDFIISMVSTGEGDEKTGAFIGSVTDSGEIISQHPIDNELFQDILVNNANGDEEILLEQFKEAMGLYLSQQFPDWQNELAYWDD